MQAFIDDIALRWSVFAFFIQMAVLGLFRPTATFIAVAETFRERVRK